mmetsp:Transcript_20420/g.53624  ORF Transcript_20420/g.53624 Transcript_20420/m.53624 type:complete len:290 (+) Transcript_20420:65-934(+)
MWLPPRTARALGGPRAPSEKHRRSSRLWAGASGSGKPGSSRAPVMDPEELRLSDRPSRSSMFSASRSAMSRMISCHWPCSRATSESSPSSWPSSSSVRSSCTFAAPFAAICSSRRAWLRSHLRPWALVYSWTATRSSSVASSSIRRSASLDASAERACSLCRSTPRPSHRARSSSSSTWALLLPSHHWERRSRSFAILSTWLSRDSTAAVAASPCLCARASSSPMSRARSRTCATRSQCSALEARFDATPRTLSSQAWRSLWNSSWCFVRTRPAANSRIRMSSWSASTK